MLDLDAYKDHLLTVDYLAARLSLSSGHASRARRGFQALPEVAGRAVGGGGRPIEVTGARLRGDLRIGRHAFTRPRISVHELPPDIPSKMTIGLRALRHFLLALDQRSMRVRFARPATLE